MFIWHRPPPPPKLGVGGRWYLRIEKLFFWEEGGWCSSRQKLFLGLDVYTSFVENVSVYIFVSEQELVYF